MRLAILADVPSNLSGLFGIETGRNVTEFFLFCARRVAASAGFSEWAHIPDVVRLGAAETLNWEKGRWATHRRTIE